MVIGIDGGTWDTLKPYIGDGTMPGLGRIIEDGAHGVLKSVIPPVTAPAWVSFATGVNPGRHGCFDFITMRSFGDFRPINATDIKVETFYETLVNNGYQCTLVNLPVSYPARIEGVLISSFMSMGDDFIQPPEILEEVPLLKRYEILPEGMRPHAESEFPHDSDLIIANEEARFEATRELFTREWDFFFVLFSGADWIQHRAYAEMLSGEGPRADGARKYFARLDVWVRWLFDNAPAGALKLIISDHGFRTLKGQFAVNTWLEEKGFLRFVRGRQDARLMSRVQQDAVRQRPRHEVPTGFAARMRDTLERSRATSWSVPVLRKIVQRSPGGVRRLVTAEYRPDFGGSRVYYHFFGFYVREDEDRESTIAELVADLRELNQGYGLFSDIARREEIYWGQWVDSAPALTMIDFKYQNSDSRKSALPMKTRGQSHSKDGIVVASGPEHLRGEITNASLMDIAPTVLDWLGVESPHRFDGRSLLRHPGEDHDPAR